MTSLPPRTELFPFFRTVADITNAAAKQTGSTHSDFQWATLFEKDQPVELDIGCGRGLFLVNASETNPDTNFVGIELDYVEAIRSARRLKKRESPNGRVLGGDVRELLVNHAPDHSVAAAHVYFPDPWWKRRHMRRRLFTDEFANMLSRVLVPGGLLHSWTDVEDYFGVISSLMNNHPDFVALPEPEERAPAHEMDYHTSFERRKRMAGLPIYRGRWQRR